MNAKTWYRCLIALLLCGLPALSLAAPAPTDGVLEASRIGVEPVPLTTYFSVLEDPTTVLRLDDVQRPEVAERFKPAGTSAASLTFGYTTSAYWLRLQVRNSSDETLDQLLEIANARLANVTLYGAFPQQENQALASGFVVPFAKRPYAHRFIIFPVVLAPNTTQTLYLRVASLTPIEIPASLWNRTNFLPHERNDYMFQAAYFGVVIAMILFNLLLFASLRDFSYLLYISWITMAAMMIVSSSGFGIEFLWDDVPGWSMASLGVFTLLSANTLIQFMRKMIPVRTMSPWADTLLRFMIGLNALLLPGLFVAYQPFAKLTLAITGLDAILILVIAIYCAAKGHRGARLFAGAFLIVLIAAITNTLRIAGVAPSNLFTANGVQVGLAIETILLAFALADRFHFLRAEKDKAQNEAIVSQGETLQAQRQLVQTLQDSERVLEGKVEQRTSELNAAFKTNETILMHSPLPMIVISASGQCIEVNQAFAELVGRTRSWLLALNTSIDKDWLESGMYDECKAALVSNAPRQREVQVVTADGKELWLDLRLLPTELKGEHHVLVQAVDLTERKRHEEELRGLAFYDGLTQLPNRRLLLDRLKHALSSSKRLNSHGAVLFLDLNKFKQLNDTHGHEAGDRLLKEVATRLRRMTRDTDTVARLGGDEFVVLLEGLGPDAAKAGENAAQTAEKIRQSLTEEYVLDEVRHHGSASTGVTLFLGDELDPDQIIRDADAAMYEEKRGRRES